LAINAGADGVHLGQSDGSIAAARLQLGSDFLIGATAHTVEEAIAAQADGADYLGVVMFSVQKANRIQFHYLSKHCRIS
jgi:thiamine monophosphate synthase